MKSKKILIAISSIILLAIIFTFTIYSINKKEKALKTFSNSITTFNSLESTYEITDKNEYDTLLKSAQDVLTQKNIEKISSTESDMNSLQKNIIDSNNKSLDDLINKINEFDISKLKSKALFEESLKTVESLKDKEDFKQAISLAVELKTSISKEKSDFDLEIKKKAEAEKTKKEQLQKINNFNSRIQSLISEKNKSNDLSNAERANVYESLNKKWENLYYELRDTASKTMSSSESKSFLNEESAWKFSHDTNLKERQKEITGSGAGTIAYEDFFEFYAEHCKLLSDIIKK